MERLRQKKPLIFKLGVNHDTKRLECVVFGEDNGEAKGTLSEDEINSLMARLSQLQYVIVLSKAGTQINLSEDATIDFHKAGEYALVKSDKLTKHTTGVEEPEGNVILSLQGSSGRLSGFRMSPEMARQVARDLLGAADQTPMSSNRSAH